MGRIEDKGGFKVPPVDSMFTTRRVENGHGGAEPLPVVDLANGMELTAWVLPKKALKAWLKGPHVLQLVKSPDGSMSMSVVPVEIVKSH